MEVIRLLIFLICLVAVLSGIYFIFFLLLRKRENSEGKLDLGKMSGKCKDCGKCGFTCAKYADNLAKLIVLILPLRPHISLSCI